MSYHLSAPVLRHSSLKPSYSCIKSIRAYFASLPRPIRDEELIIVGDRLLTYVVMANRMTRRRPPPEAHKAPDVEKGLGSELELARPDRVGPLAVLTEGLWKREALVLRALEKGMLRGVERWVLNPQEAAWRENLQYRFVKPTPVAEEAPKAKAGWVRRIWDRLRQ